MQTHISVRVTSIESRRILEPLAAKYGWQLIIGAAPLAKGFVLEFEENRLQLRDLEQPKLSALSVDFLSGSMRHRRGHGLSKNQIFAKAVGIGHRPGRTVIDTTAGLGTDAFVLACMNCKVVAIERSPIVYELLEDGYRRALDDADVGPWLSDYLRFVRGDALEYLSELAGGRGPDVVYMDPMYPEAETKSALPKKEMQLLRKLIGLDVDSAHVLELARKVAKDRVVVKRPCDAQPLAEGVTHFFKGKTARYDMYAAPVELKERV